MSDQVMRVWALPHCGASNIDINKLGTPGKPPNVKIRFWPGTAGQRPLYGPLPRHVNGLAYFKFRFLRRLLHYMDDSGALYAATANGTFNLYHLHLAQSSRRRIASIYALCMKSGGKASSGRGRPRRCRDRLLLHAAAAGWLRPPSTSSSAGSSAFADAPRSSNSSPQSTHTPCVGSSSYGSISVCKHTSPSSSAVGAAFCAPSDRRRSRTRRAIRRPDPSARHRRRSNRRNQLAARARTIRGRARSRDGR